MARLEAPITKFSYKSLLPVWYLNDWPEAYSQMAVKDLGKQSKVQSAEQVFCAKTLPKETQCLYRAGLEYRLSNPLISILEFAQIIENI